MADPFPSASCAIHEARLNRLEKSNSDLNTEVAKLSISSAKMESHLESLDTHVKDIKRKLENGISDKLENLNRIVSEIAPSIRSNKEWMDRINNTLVFVAVAAVISGIVALAFNLLQVFNK